MFFEDDVEEVYLNPELYHIVSRDLYGIGSSLDPTFRSIPTHTEDGIPIRKLYVSNLPPKTSRTELFGVFAQYGFIKSCWLRMGERGPTKSPTPTYAFVTYSNPADAFKALQAPHHEKCLRGRHLRISPADSWHQPIQDPDGRVRWKVKSTNPLASPNNEEGTTSTSAEDAETVEPNVAENAESSSSVVESEATVDPEDTSENEEPYCIMDILNRDCMDHVLAYVPIIDLIRSERVSKRWQSMVLEHLEGIHTFKTSWWEDSTTSLTTALLRRLLQKLGSTLTRLHIDHHWSSLNDRTAHIVGKFCPNLEELKVVGMHTKNWNPLIYGCKVLKSLKFVSCNKLTDSSLVQIVKNDSSVESLLIANNTHVTGLFLTGSRPPKLRSVAFYNCYSLQGTVISAAVDTLPPITTLKLDMCPYAIWKIIPQILRKLPQLIELSLSDYMSVDCLFTQNLEFGDAVASLKKLKILNLSKNIFISNTIIKQVVNGCVNLESLNISSCNPRRSYPGITDEGVIQVCKKCKQLQRLDVSYLGSLTDGGLSHAAGLPALRILIARGISSISAEPIVACFASCPQLEQVDLSGCDSVSEVAACAAVRALETHPRRIKLHLAGTAAAVHKEIPTHDLLTVNLERDLSDSYLRPDFTDPTFDDASSEDSFDDIYEHNAVYNDFFAAEEELFLDDEDFEEYAIAYGVHGPDIILI